jgi:hypothetical protein
MPVNDVPFERKSSIPKRHHIVKVFEPVPPRKPIGFASIKCNSVDSHDAPVARCESNLDFLNCDALGAHEQSRILLPQSCVQVKSLARFVWVYAHGADRVRFAAIENEWDKSRLKIIDSHLTWH